MSRPRRFRNTAAITQDTSHLGNSSDIPSPPSTVNIIGGGVGAILFATRVRKFFCDNGAGSYSINIFYEGDQNQTVDTNILNPFYAVTPQEDLNSQTPVNDLHNFNQTNIHIVGSDATFNVVRNLLTPTGLLGDVINSYYIDIGPWIQHENSFGQARAIDKFTISVPYSDRELEIVCQLKSKFPNLNLPIAEFPVITVPSLICAHYPPLRNYGCNSLSFNPNRCEGSSCRGESGCFQDIRNRGPRATRRLLLEELSDLNADPNVRFFGGCRNWNISQVDADTYSISCVSFNRVVDPIVGALYFKLLPPDFLRIVTESGLVGGNAVCYKTPAEYRIVLSIPQNKGGYFPLMEDEPWRIGTNITGSLPDLNNPDATVAWTFQAYTALEDVITTQFADVNGGNILLIIEAACYCNKRDMYYDLAHEELRLIRNSRRQESEYFDQFRTLAGAIYMAYTGEIFLNQLDFSPDQIKCTPDGICSRLLDSLTGYARVYNQLQVINICGLLFRLSFYQSVNTSWCSSRITNPS